MYDIDKGVISSLVSHNIPQKTLFMYKTILTQLILFLIL